jgi:hypothetical protein
MQGQNLTWAKYVHMNLEIRLFGFENLEDTEADLCDITAGEQDKSSSSRDPPHPRHNDLFTLSQLSPRKEDSNSAGVAPAPRFPGPVRTGAKRTISSISDLSLEPRKKGKIAAVVPVRRSPKPGVSILQPPRLNVASSSKQPPSTWRAKGLGPHIRQALGLNAEEPIAFPAPPQSDSHQQMGNVGDQRTSTVIKPGTSSANKANKMKVC